MKKKVQQQKIPAWLDKSHAGIAVPKINYRADGQTIRSVEYTNKKGKVLRRIQWDPCGFKTLDEWYSSQGSVYRLDGPASTRWHSNGFKRVERWKQNEYLHRLDGPAETWWHDNGQVSMETWATKQHGQHREGGEPSQTAWYPSGKIKQQMWYKKSRLSRLNGPALIEYYESGHIEHEVWYQNDQKHRTGGPAETLYNEAGIIISQTHYQKGKEV